MKLSVSLSYLRGILFSGPIVSDLSCNLLSEYYPWSSLLGSLQPPMRPLDPPVSFNKSSRAEVSTDGAYYRWRLLQMALITEIFAFLVLLVSPCLQHLGWRWDSVHCEFSAFCVHTCWPKSLLIRGFILQNLLSCVFKTSDSVQGPFQVPLLANFVNQLWELLSPSTTSPSF